VELLKRASLQQERLQQQQARYDAAQSRYDVERPEVLQIQE
jgi:hypothetical protein